jgi:glycogen synthase
MMAVISTPSHTVRSFSDHLNSEKKPGGFGLDDILIQKSKMLRFSGIQNAIDDEWDPRTDPWPRS